MSPAGVVAVLVTAAGMLVAVAILAVVWGEGHREDEERRRRR